MRLIEGLCVGVRCLGLLVPMLELSDRDLSYCAALVGKM